MACRACPSGTMWRSVPKSIVRWAVWWTVMLARACWWAFFPPSGACDRLSPGMEKMSLISSLMIFVKSCRF